MSVLVRRTHPRRPHAGHRIARERGYSLIELSVAILIALFLLGGVVLVEQSEHRAYGDQSGLTQLQDDERFAMSLLTEVIQSAGHFPNPQSNSAASVFAAETTSIQGQSLVFQQQQSVYGIYSGTAPNDSLAVRFMAASTENMTLCDGTSGNGNTYTNYFYVAGSATAGYYLDCELQTGSTWAASPVQLVKGLENITVLYGVTTGTDDNVDTYVRADKMTSANWLNVTSVKVTLTFVNPLKADPGQSPTVQFSRVITLMNRIGVTP